MSQVQIPTRAEIPVEQTWDLTSIYASPADWEAAYAAVTAQLPGVERFAGRLGESPAMLAEWLETWQALVREVQRIAMYAFLDYAGDTSNQEAVARRGRADTLASQVQAAVAFAEPELMEIGFDQLYTWIESELSLAIYRHYVERLEHNKAHVRSAEVEELLGQLGDPFQTASNTHGVLTNADLAFAPAETSGGDAVEVGQGNIGALVTNADRTVRRTAWTNYADAHLAYKNTMANCLIAGVKQNVFRARARRYDSALEAAMAPNNIPPAVFHNLIETFRKHLPTWQRYWRLKRQALGLNPMYEYDIKAPLTDARIHVPYDQAVTWVEEGMRPLGDEYVSVLRRGALHERWIDIYPNRGKRAGAFSYGGPGTHPFIMLNYNNDLFSMSTLAHELGHSMHSYFSWKIQPFIYARYSLFAAEVASNFNQALVRDYLLRTQTDRDFQITLIEEAMSNFHRYFFIMPTLARFELEIHERVERSQPLSAGTLIQLMADLFAEGYGDEIALDRERTGITWAEFSTHLYANFYVYQYATGIAGAHALAAQVLAGEPDAVTRYFEFLSAGGSAYPLDALRRAGVDLTTPEPVEQAFAVLADYVGRLETLLNVERR
ncbi:MAG: oligoendopeptidase F, partial [Chloroflexi bacterium]